MIQHQQDCGWGGSQRGEKLYSIIINYIYYILKTSSTSQIHACSSCSQRASSFDLKILFNLTLIHCWVKIMGFISVCFCSLNLKDKQYFKECRLYLYGKRDTQGSHWLLCEEQCVFNIPCMFGALSMAYEECARYWLVQPLRLRLLTVSRLPPAMCVSPACLTEPNISDMAPSLPPATGPSSLFV